MTTREYYIAARRCGRCMTGVHVHLQRIDSVNDNRRSGSVDRSSIYAWHRTECHPLICNIMTWQCLYLQLTYLWRESITLLHDEMLRRRWM